jgi:hypothetical protein
MCPCTIAPRGLLRDPSSVRCCHSAVNLFAAGYDYSRKLKPALFEYVTVGFPGGGFVPKQLASGHGDADDHCLYALLLLSCFARYYMGEEGLISPIGKGCYAA